MTQWISHPGLAGLILLSAIGYAAATAGIKLASHGQFLPASGLVLCGFGLAAVSETSLLRQSNLAVIYLAIVALETLLVMGLALLLGDKLSTLQLIGGVMVVSGLALVSS